MGLVEKGPRGGYQKERQGRIRNCPPARVAPVMNLEPGGRGLGAHKPAGHHSRRISGDQHGSYAFVASPPEVGKTGFRLRPRSAPASLEGRQDSGRRRE